MRKTTLLSLMLAGTLISVSCKDKASEKIAANTAEVTVENDATPKKFPVITFAKTEHDFGTIDQGMTQETSFTFTNTGEAPLIITEAKSSCGCTVPEYPKNTPIAPGESSELLVSFNGSGKNQVNKTVTLTTNTEKGKEIIRIKAFVNPKDAPKTNTEQ